MKKKQPRLLQQLVPADTCEPGSPPVVEQRLIPAEVAELKRNMDEAWAAYNERFCNSDSLTEILRFWRTYRVWQHHYEAALRAESPRRQP